jgi:hypothetical protein
VGLNVAVDGPSNAGKSTLTRALADRYGWSLLPDAGDLVSTFPPAPMTAAAARHNERYCLVVEEARSALLATGWRTGEHCLLDRSALSTLAISYGYAPEYGVDRFAEQCTAMADSLRAGRLVLPGAHLYLRPGSDTVATRNGKRPEPLHSFWLRPGLVARQLHFYDVWVGLLPPSATVTISTDSDPASVLAEASRALAQFVAARPTPPGPSVFGKLLDRLLVGSA